VWRRIFQHPATPMKIFSKGDRLLSRHHIQILQQASAQNVVFGRILSQNVLLSSV
jgi:hypothetical protein